MRRIVDGDQKTHRETGSFDEKGWGGGERNREVAIHPILTVGKQALSPPVSQVITLDTSKVTRRGRIIFTDTDCVFWNLVHFLRGDSGSLHSTCQ